MAVNPFRMALQNYVQAMTGFVASTLAPEKVLALARGEGPVSKEELMQAECLIQQHVRPGDLILTRTPSAVFGILREIGASEYDHLLAVVDGERSLHIAYPHAKLVPTTQFVLRKKMPVILRPKFSRSPGVDKVSQFTTMLKHSLVGKPYDYTGILQFFMATRLSFLAPNSSLNKYLIQQNGHAFGQNVVQASSKNKQGPK